MEILLAVLLPVDELKFTAILELPRTQSHLSEFFIVVFSYFAGRYFGAYVLSQYKFIFAYKLSVDAAYLQNNLLLCGLEGGV